MDSVADAASAVVRQSTLVLGAAADELARQDGRRAFEGEGGGGRVGVGVVGAITNGPGEST